MCEYTGYTGAGKQENVEPALTLVEIFYIDKKIWEYWVKDEVCLINYLQ